MEEKIREFECWAKIPCEECGEVFHVTKQEPIKLTGKALCDKCKKPENK